jgi:hypothetical protein
MARTQKTPATPKAPAKVKADPFAKVNDDTAATSAEIVTGLMDAEGDYATRVAHDGPILAKRIASGEKNADIARGVVEIMAGKGRKVSQNTAAQKVSRYARIGEAILKADKADDLQETIAKASAKVRGGKPKASPKTDAEKVAIVMDTLVKIIAKVDFPVLEKIDTAITTVLADAIAKRYEEIEEAEKIA